MLANDTIAAIATPPGTGGVAIIRISGSQAQSIAAQITSLKNFPPRILQTCTIFTADKNQKLDTGMAVFFAAPNSYTGEDVLELHCHGSHFLCQKILEEILKLGARLAAPGEFTKRAFLAGKLDLTQAESVADMLNAGSELQLRLAQKHLEGDVAVEIKTLRQTVLLLLAELEAALDYPEEIDDPQTQKICALLSGAQTKITKLLEDSGRGLLIKSGARIVLAGCTNAGKSSLFNALLLHDHAIVTDIAGTTRDALEAEANLGGLRVTLIDTAGLRDTADKIEALGVERSHAQIASADLILFVLDAAAGFTAEDQKILGLLSDKKFLPVINKNDLINDFNYPSAVKVSAKTGQGLPELTKRILELLDLQNIDINKNVYISSLRQKEKLISAEKIIIKTLSALKTLDYLDVLAVCLKELVVVLGEITGEEVSAEIIEKIFASFCVGK